MTILVIGEKSKTLQKEHCEKGWHCWDISGIAYLDGKPVYRDTEIDAGSCFWGSEGKCSCYCEDCR